MKIINLFLFTFFFLSLSAQAQTVKAIKNEKILIELQGTTPEIGDDFFTLDAAGKKRSIVKIKQIKNDKAIAEVLKGKPDVGHTLLAKKSADTETKESATPISAKTKSWGILGSYGIDTMNATFKNASGTTFNLNMKGSGFAALGFYELPMSKTFSLKATAGLEQFVANGTLSTAACNSGTDTNCNVNVTYLSFYGAAKYNITQGSSKFWIGGGLGYLFAAAKSSNVLNTDGLSTYIIVPSIGADFSLKHGYVPVVLDYTLYPDSSTVSANAISIRAGYAWYLK